MNIGPPTDPCDYCDDPPPEVTRVRDAQGFIAVRGPERCDYCGGSLWAWTYTRWRGEISPSGDDWVCWLDLEMISPWTAVPEP